MVANPLSGLFPLAATSRQPLFALPFPTSLSATRVGFFSSADIRSVPRQPPPNSCPRNGFHALCPENRIGSACLAKNEFFPLKLTNIFGIGFGIVAVVFVGLGYQSVLRSRRGSAECRHHLLEIYLAYEPYTSSGGDLLASSRNFGGTFNANRIPQMYIVDAYKILCTNGLDFRSTVCPSDTRFHASSIASIVRLNLSYFLSVNSETLAPTAILAGDRNISVSNGLFSLGLKQASD